MPTLPIGRGSTSLSRSLDETCSSCSVVQPALKFEANIGFSERSKASWKNHPSLLKFPPVGWHGSWQNNNSHYPSMANSATPFRSISRYIPIPPKPTPSKKNASSIFEPSPPLSTPTYWPGGLDPVLKVNFLQRGATLQLSWQALALAK